MPVPGRPHRTVSCICSGVSWVARKLAAAPPYPPPPTPDHLWHPTQFADLKIRMPSSARGPSAHAGPAVDRTHAANRTHAAARLHARGTKDHPATLDFSPILPAFRASLRPARIQTSVDCKDKQRRTRANGFQFRRRIDKPFVPGTALPDQDRDILLPVRGEGHRRRIDATTGVETPQFLQGLGIEGSHLAVGLAVE